MYLNLWISLAFTVLLACFLALFLLYPPLFFDLVDSSQYTLLSQQQSDMGSGTPLVIRNVTSTPLELRAIGRFGKSLVASVEDAATGSNKFQPGTTHHKVDSWEEASITIQPFETLTTDKHLLSDSTSSSGGTGSGQFRLKLARHGEEHFFDVHPHKHEAKELAPAAGESAESRLTAVYHPSTSQLTVFSSTRLSSWMSGLKDDTPISALSIPGTHNAPAYHHALPSVRCQAVSPKTQLENGVRFFDIRARVLDPTSDKLELVHSIFPVSLTGKRYFRSLVDDIFAFLSLNPSETVLMTVKREGLGSATDQQLARVLHDHYASDAARWFTAPRVPYLGEARGKIVLIRRFGVDEALAAEYGGCGWCLDGSAWADNTPDALTGSGDLRIQDFYGVMRTGQIRTKTEYVTGLMAKTSAVVSALPATATATATANGASETLTAAPSQPSNDNDAEKQPIHVNFLSASNFFNPRCWPEGIAAKLNPSVLEYLCLRHNQPAEGGQQGGERDGEQLGVGDGCTGIVVCDWVGHRGNWDLVRAIVGWNARLEAREEGTLAA